MVAKMSNARKMNRFKKRLYDEFEDHAYKVLGVSGDRVREVLGERGHSNQLKRICILHQNLSCFKIKLKLLEF